MKFYAVHIDDKNHPDDPSPYVWLNQRGGPISANPQTQITSDKDHAEETMEHLVRLHPAVKYTMVEFDGPGGSVITSNGKTKIRSR